jgi:hypothetical protein
VLRHKQAEERPIKLIGQSKKMDQGRLKIQALKFRFCAFCAFLRPYQDYDYNLSNQPFNQ